MFFFIFTMFLVILKIKKISYLADREKFSELKIL